jgi:hypothetical protein
MHAAVRNGNGESGRSQETAFSPPIGALDHKRIIVVRSAMSSILPPVVLDYLAAYQSGNTSRLHECIAANVLYLNATDEGALRTDGSAGVAKIIEGVHEMLADIKVTITEQHVDDGIVRLAGFLDATSKLTITGGFQYGQRVHLPIRLAMKVENDRIVKLFESS